MVTLRLVPHRGHKPDIIDYCQVSTLILPLVQKYEVVKSVPWDPHYGVRITLSIDFESVVSRQLIGKISKRRNDSTRALREGHEPDRTEEADPTLWDEARRKCVFDGKKPRCQRRAGRRRDGMFPIRKCSWFP